MNSDKTHPIDRAALELLLLGAAPEREDALHDLWTKYDPIFVIEDDQQELVFKASRERITFSYKTLRHDWTLAFAAWKAYRRYTPIIALALLFGKPLSRELIALDEEGVDAEPLLDDLLYTATALRSADSSELVEHPEHIPPPAAESSGFGLEDKNAFNLLMIATTASFIHELRHLQFFQDGDVPEVRSAEETACDIAAREFLADRSAEYATRAAEHPEAVLGLRTMGLALAAYIIHMATPTLDQGGSSNYPSSAERFTALVGNPSLPDNCGCWVFASSLLLTALIRSSRLNTPIRFTSAKDLYFQLLALLRGGSQSLEA